MHGEAPLFCLLANPSATARPKDVIEEAGDMIVYVASFPMLDMSSISFDSRYFGQVDASHVKGMITPVLTWH